MKKILILVLVITLTLGFTGCGGESPEQAVKNVLDALKVMDVEKASQYIDYKKLTEETSPSNVDGSQDIKSEEMMKLLLKNLKYKVLSFSKDGDAATVSVEITNTDMSNIMADFIREAFTLVFSGLNEEQLDEKYLEIFENLINKSDAKTVTKTVEIQLAKNEDSWKVDVNEELADAIFGGMISAAKNMNDSFGGDSKSDTNYNNNFQFVIFT